MSAPIEPNSHPSKPAAPAEGYSPTPRQCTTIYLACGLLVGCSIVLLLLPSPKIPMAGRVALASVNMIAAAILLLIVRQKSAKPEQ
ncbi:MAG: hypothetical protein CK538_10290 [Opitutia bacterium]|nr:MAG: hypothetical protein CK538_10290 [Opitutae bacterium]